MLQFGPVQLKVTIEGRYKGHVVSLDADGLVKQEAHFERSIVLDRLFAPVDAEGKT